MATGALDSSVMLWSVPDGKLVRTCRTSDGCVYEMGWSPQGDRLAACYSSRLLRVMDIRM